MNIRTPLLQMDAATLSAGAHVCQREIAAKSPEPKRYGPKAVTVSW